MTNDDYDDDYGDDDYGDDEPREPQEFGCCLPPGECVMPGLHFPSECHTAADYERQHGHDWRPTTHQGANTMTDKITIERETLLPCPFCGDDGDKGRQEVTQMIEGRNKFTRITCRACGAMCPEENWNRRAALAAQPAGPVAAALDRMDQLFEPACGLLSISYGSATVQASRADMQIIRAALAAPPAPVPPEPIAEMDAVAIKYAHKMALDLECILAEYGGSWYNTAMQTLGEYRSAMNAIHERESPTFMGEPVTAAGDKP